MTTILDIPIAKKKFVFFFKNFLKKNPRTRWFYISDKMLYLHMQYEISLQNRLQIGFALGFSYYGVDKDFDYGEIILYLGLLSLHIRYQKV